MGGQTATNSRNNTQQGLKLIDLTDVLEVFDLVTKSPDSTTSNSLLGDNKSKIKAGKSELDLSILKKCYSTKLPTSRAQLLLRTVSSHPKTATTTNASPIKHTLDFSDMESFSMSSKNVSARKPAENDESHDYML